MLLVGVCIRRQGLKFFATYEQLELKNFSCHVNIEIRNLIAVPGAAVRSDEDVALCSKSAAFCAFRFSELRYSHICLTASSSWYKSVIF